MNTIVTQLGTDFFRATRNGIDFEICRESNAPREWILAIWGAADIEGYFPTFDAALAAVDTVDLPTPTTARH